MKGAELTNLQMSVRKVRKRDIRPKKSPKNPT